MIIIIRRRRRSAARLLAALLVRAEHREQGESRLLRRGAEGGAEGVSERPRPSRARLPMACALLQRGRGGAKQVCDGEDGAVLLQLLPVAGRVLAQVGEDEAGGLWEWGSCERWCTVALREQCARARQAASCRGSCLGSA